MIEAAIQTSDTDRLRCALIRAVIAGEMATSDAAHELGITPQQFNALRRRFETDGVSAIVDRRRSGRSKRTPVEVKDAVIAVVRTHYQGSSCIQIKRALAQHHTIDVENYTLRRWLISEGLIKVRSRETSFWKPAPALGQCKLRFRYRALRLRGWLSQVKVAAPQRSGPSPEMIAALDNLAHAAAALIHQAKFEMSAHDFLSAFDPARLSYEQFARRFPVQAQTRRYHS